jgi:DNA-binding MarR family transcriptional regulator
LALDHLRRIVQALRESSRASERQLGVSGAQLFVLQALAKNRALSLNDLAERTHTHQSTVSVVVKRLVLRQLVQSRPASHDRRKLELELTPRGNALLRRAPAAAQDRLVAGLQALGTRERKSLTATLGKLARAVQLDAKPPSIFFEGAKPEAGVEARTRKPHGRG